MSDLPERSNKALVAPQGVPPDSVLIPCRPEDFSSFIRGLLGSPQTISRTLEGTFDIGIDEIRDLHFLIAQRVEQQNDGSLVDFRGIVSYSDGSTVRFSKIDDLIAYNEVKPVTSRTLDLSWKYLVQFPDRTHPEAQTIGVYFESSFGVHQHKTIKISAAGANFAISGHDPGDIGIRIAHTARTFGVDMESLLTNHLTNLMQIEAPLRAFFRKWRGVLALVGGALLMTSVFIGAVFFASDLAEVRREKAREAIQTQPTEEVLATLAEMVAGGDWPRFFLAVEGTILVAMLLALILMVFTSSSLKERPPSFIRLTKKSEQEKARLLKREGRRWWAFAASFAGSVAVGVLSNYIFHYLSS